MSRKFQYISDTHLEMRNRLPDIKIIAKNLLLLGDIGDPSNDIYDKFIKMCSILSKNVFVLYGNHEYYTNNKNNTMQNKEYYIDNINNKFNNVYSLHNKTYYLDDFDNVSQVPMENCIKIIGSILWSDINKYTVKVMNDYNYIYKYNDVLLTGQDTRDLFKINKQFILDELTKEQDIPSIVCTHHGVNVLCNGKYINSPNVTGFTTNITELSEFKNLIACINGHTHSNINTYIPNTNIKLLSNCMGYPGENVNYNPEAVLEL